MVKSLFGEGGGGGWELWLNPCLVERRGGGYG